MAFKPLVVDLGLFDDDMRPVTSVVLEQVPYEAPAKLGKAGRGKWQAVAVKAAEALQLEHEKRLSDSGLDPSTARVTIEDWRDALRQEKNAKADVPPNQK